MKTTDILIVDDEAHIVRALSFVFQREHFLVETASDGAEGLAKFVLLAPRVVFLDMVMPKMGGIDVCRAIRAAPGGQQTHIIMLTCKGQDSDRLSCLEAGAETFINKPFSPKDVLQLVKHLLSE